MSGGRPLGFAVAGGSEGHPVRLLEHEHNSNRGRDGYHLGSGATVEDRPALPGAETEGPCV